MLGEARRDLRGYEFIRGDVSLRDDFNSAFEMFLEVRPRSQLEYELACSASEVGGEIFYRLHIQTLSKLLLSVTNSMGFKNEPRVNVRR
jgi:hypothetical protein